MRQSPPVHPRGYPSLQAAFEPPSPGFRSLPSAKIFVDLFSGASAPLSAAIGALGLARLEPLDKLHGCCFDLLDDRHFRDLCLLASSGIVGAAAAAPPCASFSRARLRPGVHCPSEQSGVLQAYRRPLRRKAPNCPCHPLSTAEPDISSLLWVHMVVSFCSRTQPPVCFGWTLPSVPGCRYTRLSAHILQPVSSECHWLRPGRSGVTTTCCLLWDAAARTLLVFTRPLRASATLTAPLLRAIQHAILSPWPPPSHLACSLSFPCCQIPSSFLIGGHFFRPHSSGLCLGHASRTGREPQAQLSGGCLVRQTSSDHYAHFGSGDWRHLAFCLAYCRTWFRLARNRPFLRLPSACLRRTSAPSFR